MPLSAIDALLDDVFFPQTVRFGVLSWKRERAGQDGWHAGLSWGPADRMGGTRIGAGARGSKRGLWGWMGGARSWGPARPGG